MKLKNLTKRQIAFLIINSFLFLSSLACALWAIFYWKGESKTDVEFSGLGFFKAYTNESNLLLGIISLILVIEFLVKGQNSRLTKIIFLTANVCTTLTFITVLFFLAPVRTINGNFLAFFDMYVHYLFFFHFLNPILGFVNLLLLDLNPHFKFKTNLVSFIPTLIYGIIYFLNVVILKNWSDFYGFTFGGRYYLIPLVVLVMFGVTYLIGFLFIKIKTNQNKKIS